MPKGLIKKNRGGSALLTALLIVAFCAAVAFYLSAQMRLGIQRLEWYETFNGLWREMTGVEAWAIQWLKDQEKTKADPDFANVLRPEQMNAKNDRGYEISAVLTPHDGLWNMNARLLTQRLGGPDPVKMVQKIETRLLDHLGIQWPEFLRFRFPEYLDTLYDLPEDVRKKHEKEMAKLSRYTRSQGRQNMLNTITINPNTAPVEVLAAIFDVPVHEVQGWFNRRGEKNWTETTWREQVVGQKKFSEFDKDIRYSDFTFEFKTGEHLLTVFVKKGHMTLQEELVLSTRDERTVRVVSRRWKVLP